jgi:anti-sigma regulatory factor (Ser/Thr protein kinase)
MFSEGVYPGEKPEEAEPYSSFSGSPMNPAHSAELRNSMVLMTPHNVMVMNTSEPERRSLAFNLPVDNRAARHLRHRIMEFARTFPFTASDLDSIEIAVGEAAQNAARHGSPHGSEDHLQVYCEHKPGLFLVEITDHGNGFAPEAVPSPVAEDLKMSGYGLCLMQGLMDEIEFLTAAHGGTKVRLMKRYPVGD